MREQDQGALWRIWTCENFYIINYESTIDEDMKSIIQHVLVHVEIYGNERADGMAKEAMRRAHRNRI